MQRIKFRAKQKYGSEIGRWWYGYFSKDHAGRAYITTLDGVYTAIVDESTLGKMCATVGETEIYLGDILMNPKGREHIAVIWDNLPCLKYTYKNKVFFAPMTQGFLNNKTLVGNIHDKEVKDEK